MTRFHALVKEKKTITFPDQSLDLGGRPATEKKQGVRHKQIHMKSAFDDAASESIPKWRSV